MEIPVVLIIIASEAVAITLVVMLIACLYLFHRNKTLNGLALQLRNFVDELLQRERDDGGPEHLKALAQHIDEQYQARFDAQIDTYDAMINGDSERNLFIARQTVNLEYAAMKKKQVAHLTLAEIEAEIPAIEEQILSLPDESPRQEDSGQSDETPDDLASANQRIESLEGFKRLYFELQAQVEGTSNASDDQSNENDELDERSQAILNGFDAHKAEMKKLRNQMSDQQEVLYKLQYRYDNEEETPVDPGEVREDFDRLSKMLTESSTCIETLEMEVGEAHAEVERLQGEVAELRSDAGKREGFELRDSIKTLEDINESQYGQINALREQVAELETKLKKSDEEIS